jgi:predicted 3-demethylubiquinone-9 3-methyltransferase (glyoxalase superfamily)
MTSISPFLWFDSQAEEAAQLYVSIFPHSSITNVSTYPEGGPLPAGTVLGVSFILDGLEFQALNGGPQHPFTEAISFFIGVDTQEEVDRYWDALIADGGEPGQCGWLKDRFGLSWQVVPRLLGELLGSRDSVAASRAMAAMMQMTKLEMRTLQDAFDGS